MSNGGLPDGIHILASSIEKARAFAYDIIHGDQREVPTTEKRIPWHLQTKYYEATVEVRVGPWRESDEEVEGVIMVAHGEVLPEALADAEAFFSGKNPEVRLLALHDRAEEGDDLIAWCIEHQVECILMQALSEPGDQEDDTLAEKMGRDRVIEAVESHMWPGAAMVKPNRNGNDLDARLAALQWGQDDEYDEEEEDEIASSMDKAFSQLLSFKDNWEDLAPEERRRQADSLAEQYIGMLEE